MSIHPVHENPDEVRSRYLELTKGSPVDLAAIQEKLDSAGGAGFWRSLEEAADTPEFERFVQDEFPGQAFRPLDGMERRNFLKLMGASLALAGLTPSCSRQPTETIVPYVRQPEAIVPGKPLYFATAATLGGYAYGILVESHEGRPTKIEGLPEHPASLGAASAAMQASLLNLYDPDRATNVTHIGNIATWDMFLAALELQLANLGPGGGGLRILTETVTSPTLGGQLQAVLQQFPEARWHQYEPLGRDSVRLGSQMAFGRYVETVYDFTRAAVVFSLDSDFLHMGPGHVRYARDFAEKRDVSPENTELNRLYAVQTTPTITGAFADHQVTVRPSEVETVAAALAARLGVLGPAADESALSAETVRFLDAAARDLRAQGGASVVVPGEYQSALVHALAHAMNAMLGSAGTTVQHLESPEVAPTLQQQSLVELVRDMDAGQVQVLLMIGGNPVYDAPADLGFLDSMRNVRFRARLGLYPDETAEYCHWNIPMAHELESWSDARAFDGTVSLIQPLIAPLYDGKTAHQFVAGLLGEGRSSSYDLVRRHWQGGTPDTEFEFGWKQALSLGVLPGSGLPPAAVAARTEVVGEVTPPATSGLDLVLTPDASTWDGRFANNGWLMELPRPLTKITWDNAALISPATAQRLQLNISDAVDVVAEGRRVRLPVWILPGHPDDAVSVQLGYGRWRAGHVGTGVGTDTYALRTTSAPFLIRGAALEKTRARHPLATTEDHHSMERMQTANDTAERRHLIRIRTVAEYRNYIGRHADAGGAAEASSHDGHHAEAFAGAGHHHAPSPDYTLYTAPFADWPGHAWGMTIDLNKCTGCNACIVACQSENNIPVVGKTEVMRGREMHWIRVDRYYRGSLSNPEAHFQPVPCMHCETAPCEPVCPVAATVHSQEGLNEMVYNRCIGTRYCSNNCPYKVRRFNFFHYAKRDLLNPVKSPVLKQMKNPDVTVRSRGVMEKCTYCVQRINHGRIEAKKENRRVRDGEVLTACQQACPSAAITFGDINDPGSVVHRLRADARSYGLLEDIGTRPRTTYLVKLRNPNGELG
jgi:MoCo/4Fe-4S cofactor protein with predicted Tat translocation signal